MLSWDRVAFGQHDASWIGGWAETFRRFGIELSDAHNAWLDGMLGMLECGWWWPMRGAIVFTDRPDELHRDAQGRLHNERGMAIGHSDGWGFHAIHGVRVTEQIVMRPEELTITQILEESNAEIRRVMCERYGWDRFVVDADLKLVDECDDPANEPNTIRLYDLPDHFQVFGNRVRLITVVNASPERDGTIRRFGLTVPFEKSKALDAAAWTFGTDAKTYRTLARAT